MSPPLQWLQPVTPLEHDYAVQVAVFRNPDDAEMLRREIEARYGAGCVLRGVGDVTLWRVLVGSPLSQVRAESLAKKIRRDAGISAFSVGRPFGTTCP